jgi:predicted O-methyltransferase YrrM
VTPLHVQIARSVLPAPVKRFVRDRYDLLQLRRQSPTGARFDRLAPAAALDLAAIFGNPRFDLEWAAASERVAAVLPRFAEGAVNRGDQRALYYLIRHLAPSSVLEVGTHLGASTVHIALALAAGDAPGRLTTVDVSDVNAPTGPWRKAGMAASPRDALARLSLGNVDFVVADSIAFLRATENRFDFIFLDGSHAAAQVYAELQHAQRILRPGGLVLLHDYFPEGRRLWANEPVHPGPWRALARLRAEGAPIAVRPLGELPWPTKGPETRLTSLALVARAN